MTDVIKASRQKVVVLASSLSLFAAASTTVPAMVVRHGGRAVWVVIPMVLLEAVIMVLMVMAVVALQKATKRNG